MNTKKNESTFARFKGKFGVALLRSLSLLPLSWSQRLGASIGRLGLLLNTREVRIARQNLLLCFPELTVAERKNLLKQSFLQSGMLAAEIAYIWFRPPSESLAHIKQVHGEAIIEAAHQQKKGVIVILPHLGNWEMINAYILQSYPSSAMYTPAHLQAINRVMVKGREQTGLKMEEASTKGVMGLFKTLRKGGSLLILPDQEPAMESGEFAEFFGIQALTMTLISKLANKSQSPAVIAYVKRNAIGKGFDIIFKAIDNEKLADDDIHVSLNTLNKAVEDCVREEPAQYMWGYKRFRKVPEGKAKRYS